MLVGNEGHTVTKQVVSVGVALYINTGIHSYMCICLHVYVNIYTYIHIHTYRPNSQCKPICPSLMVSRELIMMANTKNIYICVCVCVCVCVSESKLSKVIVYILLGISPASNCSWPTFWNLVSVPSSKAGCRL